MVRRALSATGAVVLLAVGGAAQPVAADTHGITTVGSSFSPATLTVQQGDTVVWSIEGGVHTVTADDGGFDSGSVSPGGTVMRTFTTPGVVGYHCTLHGGPGSGMAGQIIVQATTTTTASTSTTSPGGATSSTTGAGSRSPAVEGTRPAADVAPGATGPELARTGRATAPAAWFGSTVLAAGTLALVAARRWRSRS